MSRLLLTIASLLLGLTLWASGLAAAEKPNDKVRPPEGIEIGMSTNEIAITPISPAPT